MDYAKKMKTHSSPALRRSQETNSSTTIQCALPVMNGMTKIAKRKLSRDQRTPRKTARLTKSEPPYSSEDDQRVRSLKRKITDDGEGPSSHKRSTGFEMSQDCVESASSSVDTVREGDMSKRGIKRKASADVEGPSRKRSLDLRESNQDLSVDAQRARFNAKYKQLNQLGQGGCGSVFAGSRKSDGLQVAIKHIPKAKVLCTQTEENGNQLSVEVAIMLKLAETSGPLGTSASISLLDWYDLEQELILVLERPIPAQDLYDYIEVNGGSLSEDEAKIILKQLVDAVKELENNSIFHRDIKVENILIETGSDVPHIRLIDFGLSCFVNRDSSYRVFYGTTDHIPPEWYSSSFYSAGPTTVWQLGVVLYESLHKEMFETKRFLRKKLKISTELSQNLCDFLRMCLSIAPEERPTLEQLQLHPWLR